MYIYIYMYMYMYMYMYICLSVYVQFNTNFWSPSHRRFCAAAGASRRL